MLIPCAYVIHGPDSKMLLAMFYHVPPVVRAPREKAPLWVCRLRQTTQVQHGEGAFATAMRPSIDSDGERLAIRESLQWVNRAILTVGRPLPVLHDKRAFPWPVALSNEPTGDIWQRVRSAASSAWSEQWSARDPSGVMLLLAF
jgi:hypothetical protein